MGKRIAKVLDIDGQFRENPDFPVAVVREDSPGVDSSGGKIVDPIYNSNVYNNLYGRMMTLLEATCEASRLKAVKDVFGKELLSWHQEVHNSAQEIANGGNSSGNLYIRVGRFN